MIEKLKLKILKKFKKFREKENKLKDYGELVIRLKAQMVAKRKIITELRDNLVNTVNELNLLGEKMSEKSKTVKELSRRRDEFLKRVSAVVIDTSIDNFPDYKYWISEPFIKDKYEPYSKDDDDIDEMSAIRGLGKLFNNVKKES